MHFLDGLNIDRIGVVFGVHRATVARWIAAARERGAPSTRHARAGQSRLRLGPAVPREPLPSMRSSLELSLRTLLAEA